MIFSIFTSSKYTFDGKKEGETVELLLYRHWFVIVIKLILIAIAAVVPFFIYAFLQVQIVEYHLITLFLFLLSVYYLIIWFVAFFMITMYVLDTWVITNFRVIDSRQHGYFSRTVSELQLSRIQDVSINVAGFIPTLLNFGDLEVQTAATENKFFFKQIANPKQVKDELVKLSLAYKHSHPEER